MMWRKYEGADIVSLKPAQRVSWKPQTTPGQLEQDNYTVRSRTLFHSKGTHHILSKQSCWELSFFVIQTPTYPLLLGHHET